MEKTVEVALITGGSRGIGKALAERMLREGKQVVIIGQDPERLAQSRKDLSEDVLAIVADVSSLSDTRNVVEQIIGRFGQIDVLINNAGITGATGPILDIDPDEWWRTQEVNLRGVFNYAHCVLPHMVKRKSGAIFNMGSYVAIRPTPMAMAYSTSKAAVARLTDSLALAVAEHGIDVFCLSPGLVETDMSRDAPPFQNLPASAWSKPEQIGQLVMDILSRDCSGISGRFITVNDDLDVILNEAERVRAEGLFQLGMHGLEGRIE